MQRADAPRFVDVRPIVSVPSCRRIRRRFLSALFVPALMTVPSLCRGATVEEPASEVAAATTSDGGGSLGELSLEELMDVRVTTQSTLSRVDERIDDAPGSVYVYTRETIKNRGYRSLLELLETVPGFTVFHRDLQYVVGVRGLNANDNDKISLLVNGQRILGLHEQDFLNGPINLDNVDRVEVVVGPSAFFEPADTLTGTVNLITKDVDGVETIVAAGNALEYSSTLMAGHHWAPDKFVSVSFTTEAKRGFDAWSRDFKSNLMGRDVTGELNSPSYFGILKLQNGEFSAQAIAYRASWPELNIENGDPKNEGVMVEQFYSIALKDEHEWSDTLTSVTKFNVALKGQTRRNDGGDAPANAVEQVVHQLTYEGEVGLLYTGFQSQLIQAGVQASYDDNYDTFFTFNNDNPPEHVPKTTLVSKDTYAVGFYLDDTVTVTKWLKLIGGVRMDHNGRLDGNRWFPGARAAIIAQPTSFWTSKLIYNRAARMPSALEALNEVWGSEHLDNPRSPSFARLSSQPQNPEVLSTFELQNIFYLGRVRVGTAIYHQELEDFITWFSPHSNGGNFRGNGIEVSLQAPVGPRVTFWANGSWNDSELHLFEPELFGPPSAGTESFHANVNADNRIIGSAQYTANLGLSIKLMDHLTFSPSVRYFTEQAAVKFRTEEEGGPISQTIRDRFYLDAALVWDHAFGQEIDVRLSGRNLLDNRRAVASQLQGDTYRPRGIEGVLTVEMRF